MDPNKALNMTMLCDFYELTMGNGYLEHDIRGWERWGRTSQP